MNKFYLTLILCLISYNTALAESYFFKNCKINARATGDYIIDIDKKFIIANLKTTDGKQQELRDKIKSITKNQIISEIIQSGAGKNRYFQYYLNSNSNSITKLTYIKENDFFKLEGKRESFCLNVKANWNEIKIIDPEVKKQLEFEKKKEEERIEAKKKKETELTKKKQKKKEKKKIQHEILIVDKKWIKLSKADVAKAEHLKDDFKIKASELCSSTKDFDILKQKIEVVEMDDTPAWGLETVVKFGIKGIVECK